MAAHSSILAWKIPWTEEPGGLQSMGSQRVACWENPIQRSLKQLETINIQREINEENVTLTLL